MKSAKANKYIRQISVLFFWLLVWYLLARLVDLPLLLPEPEATFHKLFELWGKGNFWVNLGGSFLRVTLGFLLAVIFGSGLAVLCARFQLADALLRPVRSLIRSTPISSFIILVLLWLTVTATPLFISFLAVMPLIWQDVQQGIEETPAELLEMAQSYQFSRLKRALHIYLPSLLPYFYAACANGIGIAWKACVAAEVIARPMYSVGKNLQDAKVYLLTDELFAWTLTVIILSMALEILVRKLIRRRGFKAGTAGERS